jgi:Tfp pilus assembly protein FimT
MVEMLVVMVMMGILMSIALPRFGAIRDRAAVSSAKQKLIGYLATTRAAAIRQSSSAEFRLWDNNVSATVTQPNGTRLSLGSAEHLDKTEGVVITRGTGVVRDLITYDSRGLSLIGTVTTPRFVYVVTRNNVKDSICVSRLGLIARTCGS